jgi:hypothetical protein
LSYKNQKHILIQFCCGAGPKYLLKKKKNLKTINGTKVIAFVESPWGTLYTDRWK